MPYWLWDGIDDSAIYRSGKLRHDRVNWYNDNISQFYEYWFTHGSYEYNATMPKALILKEITTWRENVHGPKYKK